MMEVGMQVWVPSAQEVWMPVTILSCEQHPSGHEIQFQCHGTDTKFMRQYSLSDGHDTNSILLQNDINDYTKLHCLLELRHVHEPALLEAVHRRFEKNVIYTFMDEILLAVNPFTPNASYYSTEQIALYQTCVDKFVPHRDTRKLPPHVYAIAANAYSNLIQNQWNQSILVSGESGAGKTETSKFLMHFLTCVRRNASKEKSMETFEIGQRILQTNPILESFGNARTIRNDNSSRFGKLIRLQFDHKTKEIVGAEIAIYLLEHVRVIYPSQEKNERNFHIFYEFLEGAHPRMQEELGINRECLNQFELLKLENLTMEERQMYGFRFSETVRAMNEVGISGRERFFIFQILAAILHLGNVHFTQGAQDEVLLSGNDSHFEASAQLLGVDEKSFFKLLTIRNIRAGGESVWIRLSIKQAMDIKYSFIKSIYSRLFTWLVQRLSQNTNWRRRKRTYLIDENTSSRSSGCSSTDQASPVDDSTGILTIGILDIFGFENLQKNGFEQLCINYANERLQAQFNDYVFCKQQQLYELEGIEWRTIQCPSNLTCLELFDHRQNGLFSFLDQECMVPNGSNESLATKLYRCRLAVSCNRVTSYRKDTSWITNKKSSSIPTNSIAPMMDTNNMFTASKIEQAKSQFCVRHFAGQVIYTIDHFVEKNVDALPAKISDILFPSSNEIIAAIGLECRREKVFWTEKKEHVQQPEDSDEMDNLTKSKPASNRKASTHRCPSVSSQFRSQLDLLIDEIGETQSHYIRCLKANEDKEPNAFNRIRMVEQLRSVGIVEAAKIARCGYTVRLLHAKFLDLFDCTFQAVASTITKDSARLQTAEKDLKIGLDVCRALRQQAKCSLPAFSSTSTKNPSKHPDIQIGKTLVFCKRDTYHRLYALRIRCQYLAAAKIQSTFKAYRGRHWYRQTTQALCRFQSHVRPHLRDRIWRLKREQSAIKLQRCWRGYADRADVARMHQAATLIQATARGYHVRHTHQPLQKLRQHYAAIRIQENYRLHRFRRAFASAIEDEQRQNYALAAASVQRWWRLALCHKLALVDTETLDWIPEQKSRPVDQHSIKRMDWKRKGTRCTKIDENQEFRKEFTPTQAEKEDPMTPKRRSTSQFGKNGLHRYSPTSSDTLFFESTETEKKNRLNGSPFARVDSGTRSSIGYRISNPDEMICRRSTFKNKLSQHFRLLERKIEELELKCKGLESLVLVSLNEKKTLHKSERRRRWSQSDLLRQNSHKNDGTHLIDANFDVDNVEMILEGLQQQMDSLRQSLHSTRSQKESITNPLIVQQEMNGNRDNRATLTQLGFPGRSRRRGIHRSRLTEPDLRHPHTMDIEADTEENIDSSRGTATTSGVLVPSSSNSLSSLTTPLPLSVSTITPRLFRISNWARSVKCYQCLEPFTLFTRRHHCRLCGKSFCNEHSSRRVSVFGVGYDDEPVRACDGCFSMYYFSLTQRMPADVTLQNRLPMQSQVWLNGPRISLSSSSESSIESVHTQGEACSDDAICAQARQRAMTASDKGCQSDEDIQRNRSSSFRF